VSVTVLIADDDDLMRAGLRMILETDPEIVVIGEAADGQAAVTGAAKLRPDVVPMDIRMPGIDGIEAIRRITGHGNDPPRVLILTTFELDEYLFNALQSGASGFLLKRTPPDELLHGIKIVAAGNGLLSPTITRRLIEEFARRPTTTATTDTHQPLDQLTERESEILTLMARGLSNSELAAQLYIGESTVKSHIKHILTKLGARDRVHAIVHAYQAGLVRAAPHPQAGPPPHGKPGDDR
jgi:DNA-binding NarL/FixJ family response regulator